MRAASSIWFQAVHAFWPLSDDRGACSPGHAGRLRALSIGHVGFLDPAQAAVFEHRSLETRRNNAALAPGSSQYVSNFSLKFASRLNSVWPRE